MKTSDICDSREDASVCALHMNSWGALRSFSGRIRTVQCFEDIVLIRNMLKQPSPGEVLVVDGGGSTARALFGDTMAGVAIANGWKGVVVNGAVRDCSEVNAMAIGLKALATTPRRGDLKGEGNVDVAVHFGGITFTPGHVLVADEDGVVVLPPTFNEADFAAPDNLTCAGG